MATNQLMFILFALMIIVFSILTVTTRKILRAATFLLFVLVSTSGIYFMLNYQFLAAIQLTLYAGGIVVLIEPFPGIVERDRATHPVPCGDVVSPHLEPVPVTLERRIAPDVDPVPECPALVDHYGMGSLIEIPPVVRVLPRPAADELVSRADVQFRREPVRVLAVPDRVVVPVRVAIEDQVVMPPVADLQPTVVILEERRVLDQVVAPRDVHPVVSGPPDLEPPDVPVVPVERDPARCGSPGLR